MFWFCPIWPSHIITTNPTFLDILGHFNGVCGFRIVAIRFVSTGTPLFTHKSGCCSFVVSGEFFDFDFSGKRINLAIDISGDDSGLASFDDIGGGGNGNEPSLCLVILKIVFEITSNGRVCCVNCTEPV